MLGLMYFGGFYPALWSSMIAGNYAIFLSIFTFVFWVLLFLSTSPKHSIKKISNTYVLFISVLIVYYLCRYLIFEDVVHYRIFVIITSSIVIILVKTMTDEVFFMKLLTSFQIFMVFSTFIGVILFFTGLLNSPDVLNQNLYEGKVFLNYKFFLVKVNKLSDFNPLFIRPGGFYDEPGSFSYITLLLLIYNKKYFNNRFYEISLLFGGLITLSAAHIITVIIYCVFFFLNKRNWWIFVITLIIFIGIYYLPIDQEWFNFFKSRSYDRIIDIFEGDDKSRDYNSSFEAFKYFFITGGNVNNIIYHFPDAYPDTIWVSLAIHGIIGALIFYLPFVYIFIKSLKFGLFSTSSKLIIIYLINLIQRPDYIAPLYLFIIYFIWFDNSQRKVEGKDLFIKNRIQT